MKTPEAPEKHFSALGAVCLAPPGVFAERTGGIRALVRFCDGIVDLGNSILVDVVGR